MREECHETTPTQDQNLVNGCLRIWRSFLKIFDNEQSLEGRDKKEIMGILDWSFLFSVIWSLCISVNTEYRKPFDDKIKKLLQGDIDGGGKKPPRKIAPGVLDRGTIYDYVYIVEKNEWKHWMDLVDKNETFPKNMAPQEIIVTTIDKVRYSHMLKLFIDNMIPALYVGPTGTGKSIYIQNVLLTQLDREKYNTIEVGFSAQTSAN